MLKRYFKSIVRNITRNPFYILINISGLAIAISCSAFIVFFVTYEFSYDKYNKNASNIYRLVTKRTQQGSSTESARTPAPVGPALFNELPEVLNYVRFSPTVERAFSYQDKKFFESGVFYADQTVFDIFSINLLTGNPSTALEAPFTMVLTKSLADKYFGSEEAIGKYIKWDNNFEYRVTGVIEDLPPNSHFQINVIASFATFIKYDERIGSWGGGSFQTYLLLEEGVEPSQFQKKLEEFKKRHLDPRISSTGVTLNLSLQPLTDIHLKSFLEGEMGVNGNIQLVYSFMAIAILILIVASINFANLTVSMKLKRIRTVGIKKIYGANRLDLFFQQVGESVIYTLLATLVGIVLVYLFRPLFDSITGIEVISEWSDILVLIPLLIGIVLFTGIMAGLYPALFLSSFDPLNVLRSSTGLSVKKPISQSILVVFQFTVSAMLFSGALIIYQQQHYMNSKDLGFNKDKIMVIALQNKEVRSNLNVFKNELLKLPGIKNIGASSMVPGEMYLFTTNVVPQGFPDDQPVTMDNFLVDESFLDTYQIEIVEGRGFSNEFQADTTSRIIINQTAAMRLGWDDPVGKTIRIPGIYTSQPTEKEIIGVFRDINQRSLYNKVAPTFLQYVSNEGAIENRARRLSVRIESENIAGVQKNIEQLWKEIYPDHPIYSFYLDDYYNGLHLSESRLSSLFSTFAFLALFIGSLGLLGLTSYMVRQRMKEVGVRKVLGSSMSGLAFLLSRRFLLLVVIANIAAAPFTMVFSSKWLENYPYSIQMSYSIYIISALTSIGIAIITISYHILKASNQNPAFILRYD